MDGEVPHAQKVLPVHPCLCQVLLHASKQTTSCSKKEGLRLLGRPASRGPEDHNCNKKPI